MLVKATKSIQDQVISRIYGHGRGWVFTPNNFHDIGGRQAVSNALRRLARSKKIERIGHGLYHYPRKHPVLGLLKPAPDVIAHAIAGRAGARLLPSRAYAANLLGLSEQVPAKIIFLTDAPYKKVRVGKQLIELKHTATIKLLRLRKITGLVVQALRYLGEQNITPAIIDILRARLNDKQKQLLIRDLPDVPTWTAPHLRAIANRPPNG